MNSHARIVIVGGGIMGVGLLYHLAEAGCRDVEGAQGPARLPGVAGELGWEMT